MWPDHETNADLLGFQHLVSAVTRIAGSDALLPATIGVFGDWGSGKSSLLKMAAEELAADDTLVLTFNGWLFEGYDDAKSALMETIIDEVTSKRKLSERAAKLALRLLRRVNWFRVAGSAVKYGAAYSVGGPLGLAVLAGLEAKDVVQKVGETLEGIDKEQVEKLIEDEPQLRRNIREFREDFSSLIAETKLNRLVVLIDDLDRCLPDTVIETLEAIKLFLFVPHTAFVIGADERLVRYAVRRRFPELPGESASVGRDYLEKLVQYPVRIPRLTRPEIQTYLSLLFAESEGVEGEKLEVAREWIRKTESISRGRAFGQSEARDCFGTVSAGLADSLALAARLAPMLAEKSSGNPRQCKRFLNTMVMRLEMAVSRGVTLKRHALVKLMLLEEFRPSAFKRLGQLQADQNGKPELLRKVEEGAKPSKKPKAPTHVQRGGGGGDKKDAEEPTKEKGAAEETAAVDADLEAWLADSWLRGWAAFEPRLSDEDLRPYFYFSRDILGPGTGAVQRLSADAQEFVLRLLNDSDAVRSTARSRASDLEEGDAAAILEDLTSRAQGEEDRSAENSSFRAMFDLVGARKEMAADLVTCLESFPEPSLPVAAPLLLANTCKGTAGEAAARALVTRWSRSATPALKRAAGSAAKRMG